MAMTANMDILESTISDIRLIPVRFAKSLNTLISASDAEKRKHTMKMFSGLPPDRQLL